jgi:hypothetical protein
MTQSTEVPPSEELEEVHSVEMSLSDGIISLDEQGTRVLTIKAKALDEGVWNGLYFKPEDIKEKLEMLSGRRVLVGHTYEKPDDVMGWVEEVDSEGAIATLRIFDANSIDAVQSGELNAVSVGVLVQQTNGVVSIQGFNEISLTGNPACSTCVIESYSEQTLELEEPKMTEETVETTEELCACDDELPLEATPVVQESSTLTLENETLKAELSILKENVEVLRQHKEALELERKTNERQVIVSSLVSDGLFKPANTEDLHSLLMSLDDRQMKLFENAAAGLGPVVVEQDLAEVEYTPPVATAAADLEKDMAEFRAALGMTNIEA